MYNAYNIASFLNYFKGKNIDFDGAFGFQCADLGRKFIEDVNGWNCQSFYYKPFLGNGKYGDNGVLDGFYSFEKGDPSVVLREGTDRSGKKYRVEIIKDFNNWMEGDIVFFNVPSHQYGHVGVRTNSDKVPGKIEVFDQNSTGHQDTCSWNNYPKSWFIASLRKVYIEEVQALPVTPIAPIIDLNSLGILALGEFQNEDLGLENNLTVDNLKTQWITGDQGKIDVIKSLLSNLKSLVGQINQLKLNIINLPTKEDYLAQQQLNQDLNNQLSKQRVQQEISVPIKAEESKSPVKLLNWIRNFKLTDANGRILGISKKLTALASLGPQIALILEFSPDKYKEFLLGVSAIITAIYLIIQGLIDAFKQIQERDKNILENTPNSINQINLG